MSDVTVRRGRGGEPVDTDIARIEVRPGAEGPLPRGDGVRRWMEVDGLGESEAYGTTVAGRQRGGRRVELPLALVARVARPPTGPPLFWSRSRARGKVRGCGLVFAGVGEAGPVLAAGLDAEVREDGKVQLCRRHRRAAFGLA